MALDSTYKPNFTTTPESIKTAKDFYEIMLAPTCTAYLRNFSGSVPHATFACMTIYHMGDWLVKERGYNNAQKIDFFKSIRNTYPEMDIVQDVTNCTKHNDRDSPIRLESARHTDNAFNPLDHQDEIYYVEAIKNDKRTDLRPIIEKGLEYWKNEMSKV